MDTEVDKNTTIRPFLHFEPIFGHKLAVSIIALIETLDNIDVIKRFHGTIHIPATTVICSFFFRGQPSRTELWGSR